MYFKWIFVYVSNLCSTQQNDDLPDILGSPLKRRKVYSFKSAQSSKADNEDFLINKEYTDYCSMPYDDEIDLKEFWVLNRLKFPCLFQLALKFLSIPASSGPVERLFSYAGYIIRPHSKIDSKKFRSYDNVAMQYRLLD